MAAAGYEVFSDESDSSSSSSEDEGDFDIQLLLMAVTAMRAYLSMIESFQPIELSQENQSTVNLALPVNDLLTRHMGNPGYFRVFSNFTLEEFEELCRAICPTIQANARSTGMQHTVSGRPCKLSPEQRLLSFILYLKHDNTITFDVGHWNWCKAALCDDALFISSCVNEALANEIRWPTQQERRELGTHIPQLPGCIGVVDGTLVRIRRPFEDPQHRRWFQGRKKMYCMNSSVVVDHNGLFIYIDPGYPGLYHECTILQNSWVEANFRDLFVNTPDYCEYVLGDSGYKGMEHYVMRGYSKTEIRAMRLSHGTVRTFNKMHSGYRVKVEWGIGGLKMKWRRLQKRWDTRKPRFKLMFTLTTLLTNFIHRRRKNMNEQVVGERDHARNRGWAGDY